MPLNYRQLWCAVAIMAAAPATAGEVTAGSARYYEAAELDRAIAEYLGQPTGRTGGSENPLDPRLRLARCEAPLEFGWHGTPGRTLALSCPAQGGWRIFIAVNAPNRSAQRAAPAVRRGEQITLLIRGRGFSLQSQGLARDTGAVGDWIRIELPHSPEPVRGLIERPGLALLEVQ